MEDQKLTVKIDAFEGPLDLLLHLIQQLEVDIYDIPIAEVTDQYLNYLQSMKEADLDIAGDFLVMASTLMAIKSSMLIPRPKLDPETQEEMDPREDLTQLLLQYQMAKEAAQKLDDKHSQRATSYSKLPEDLSFYQESFPLDEGLYTMADLIQAALRARDKAKLRKPRLARIEREEISVEEKMELILEEVEAHPAGSTRFSDLLSQYSRQEVVAVFAALLQLLKSQEVQVLQEENFADIWIRKFEEGEMDV